MKKSIFIIMCTLFVGLSTFHVHRILAQISLGDLFKIEALAEGECSQYDYDDEILGKQSEFCWEHDTRHEWMACSPRTGKCCDSRSQTTKPKCL